MVRSVEELFIVTKMCLVGNSLISCMLASKNPKKYGGCGGCFSKISTLESCKITDFLLDGS